MSTHAPDPGIRGLSGLFKCLSDPTRLGILNLLCEEEVCVCHFVGVLDVAQPHVSRHLACLKKAGLVEARRDGKWIHYRRATPGHGAVRIVSDGLRDWMMKDKAMTAQRRKLKRVRCK